jgi:hypothetical protein
MGRIENNARYTKIRFCGKQAAKDGLYEFWVNTYYIET